MESEKSESASNGAVNGSAGESDSQVYICVSEEDDAGIADRLELPIESDGTLSLQTLVHAFPDATGLKYKNPNTGAFRALGLDGSGTKLQAPGGVWGERCYVVIFKNKPDGGRRRRHGSDETAEPTEDKRPRLEADTDKCTDLVVLNLPFKTTCQALRDYFEQFGVVVVAEVKSDFRTGKPKGFGFVQFADYDTQCKVLAQYEHLIDGRVCQVKIPNSKQQAADSDGIKIYVGRLPASLSQADLTGFFQKEAAKYGGQVDSVLIPKPHRGFAFVTLNSAEVARRVIKQQDYVVEGHSVCVSAASPKEQSQRPFLGSNYGIAPLQQPKLAARTTGAPRALNPWSQSATAGSTNYASNFGYGTYGTSWDDMRAKAPSSTPNPNDQNLQAAWQAFWNTLTASPSANASAVNWYNQSRSVAAPTASGSGGTTPNTSSAW